MSTSNLLQRVKAEPVQGKAYDKPEDTALVRRIEAVLKERASYGYRRVTAILNRQPDAEPVNHKRVYRIMRARNLLLRRHNERPTKTHDGKSITLKSDLRWCSDALEFRCGNGDKVYVVFSLDCCDRETIRGVAKTPSFDGQDIRDLMAPSIEERFDATTTPHKIQWLSDNGPPFTAHETRAFGSECGFEVCNTPSYSPESNGMAEDFVKTFKRDYVDLADLR